MKGKSYYFLKRIIDILGASVLIIILSPILLVISLAIKLDSKGEIVFKQRRLGRYGKQFWIYKFRTMCVGAENMGDGQYCKQGDSRVTRVGKILRKTSLDELMQLFNILKGDMSFIGPRPPLTYHPWSIDEYTPEQMKRFDVRPGITGLAQISGRKHLEWPKRIEYDVKYVENISLWLDIKICFITAFKVLFMLDNENTEESTKTKTTNR